MEELRAVYEVFERIEAEAEVLPGIHPVAALVAGSFVVGVEGAGLPVAFGGGGDGFVEGEERGRGFEPEFRDEA